MNNENDILTLDQTLQELGGISVSTLRRMMDRGEITPVEDSPILKRRRNLRFRRGEVQRVLEEARAKEAHFRRIA